MPRLDDNLALTRRRVDELFQVLDDARAGRDKQDRETARPHRERIEVYLAKTTATVSAFVPPAGITGTGTGSGAGHHGAGVFGSGLVEIYGAIELASGAYSPFDLELTDTAHNIFSESIPANTYLILAREPASGILMVTAVDPKSLGLLLTVYGDPSVVCTNVKKLRFKSPLLVQCVGADEADVSLDNPAGSEVVSFWRTDCIRGFNYRFRNDVAYYRELGKLPAQTGYLFESIQGCCECVKTGTTHPPFTGTSLPESCNLPCMANSGASAPWLELDVPFSPEINACASSCADACTWLAEGVPLQPVYGSGGEFLCRWCWSADGCYGLQVSLTRAGWVATVSGTFGGIFGTGATWTAPAPPTDIAWDCASGLPATLTLQQVDQSSPCPNGWPATITLKLPSRGKYPFADLCNYCVTLGPNWGFDGGVANLRMSPVCPATNLSNQCAYAWIQRKQPVGEPVVWTARLFPTLSKWRLLVTETAGSPPSTSLLVLYESAGYNGGDPNGLTLTKVCETGGLGLPSWPNTVTVNSCGGGTGTSSGGGGCSNLVRIALGVGQDSRVGTPATVDMAITVDGGTKLIVCVVGATTNLGAPALPAVSFAGTDLNRDATSDSILLGADGLRATIWSLTVASTTTGTLHAVQTAQVGQHNAILVAAVEEKGLTDNATDVNSTGTGLSSTPDTGATAPTADNCEYVQAAFGYVGFAGPAFGGGFFAGQGTNVALGAITINLQEGWKVEPAAGATPDATLAGTPSIWAGAEQTYS